MAHAVNRTTRQEVQIVVYNRVKNDETRETALNLRDSWPAWPEHEVPIMVNCFDAAETQPSANSDNLQLSPSVLIFSNPLKRENRRNTT
jgi:hypothetical protein